MININTYQATEQQANCVREIKISPKAETRNILYGELLKEPFTLGGDSKLTAEQRKQLLAAIKDYIRVGGVK